MRLPLYNAARINSPGKRLGYVAFVTGIASASVSLALFLIGEFHPGYWGNVWEGVFFGWPQQFWRDWNYSSNAEYRRFCYGGAGIGILGWLFSYGYDATMGRLVRWVRTGSA